MSLLSKTFWYFFSKTDYIKGRIRRTFRAKVQIFVAKPIVGYFFVKNAFATKFCWYMLFWNVFGTFCQVWVSAPKTLGISCGIFVERRNVVYIATSSILSKVSTVIVIGLFENITKAPTKNCPLELLNEVVIWNFGVFFRVTVIPKWAYTLELESAGSLSR